LLSLWFRLHTSRRVGQYIFVALNHPVFGLFYNSPAKWIQIGIKLCILAFLEMEVLWEMKGDFSLKQEFVLYIIYLSVSLIKCLTSSI
jgi:hypothetical protein